MIKNYYFTVLLSLISIASIAQKDSVPASPWKKGGNLSLNLSQAHHSNWVKGGENAFSFISSAEFFANYAQNNWNWENSAKFRYGMITQGQEADWRKNEDLIDLNSKVGYKASKKLLYSAFLNIRSQLADGYEYPDEETKNLVSAFWAPAYITTAIGIDFKPNAETSVFFSPVTGRVTMVGDTSRVDQTKYGLEADKSIRNEFGAIVKIAHKKKIWEDIELSNSLELFSNYIENPQNVDVLWDATLLLPINKFLKTTISTNLIYDHDTKIPVFKDGEQVGTTKKIQFREVLSVGLMVKF